MKKSKFVSSVIIKCIVGLFVLSILMISANAVNYTGRIIKENDPTLSTDVVPTIQSGWLMDGKNWTYADSNGQLYKNGLFEISEKKYLFDKNGLLLTGVQTYGAKLYYFSNSGASPSDGFGAMLKYTGWRKINSNTYYFLSNYTLASGWKKISKSTYYFNSSGKMRTGWFNSGGKKYYLKPSGKSGVRGKLLTGWQKIKGKKYYFTAIGKIGIKGKMVKGLKKIGNFRYYLGTSGALQKNGIVGSKKSGYYYADKNGRINLSTRKAVDYKGKKWNILNGKATRVKTTKQLTLYRALKLTAKITKFKGSKSKQLRKCFNYMKNAYVEMNPRVPHYHGKDWCVLYANDMFVKGAGNCFSYASAFAYVAKAIGYKNVYCCNSGGHGWAEINGLIYDPEWSRHHSDNSFYALSYDTKTTNDYKGAISPGYSWMHVKI